MTGDESVPRDPLPDAVSASEGELRTELKLALRQDRAKRGPRSRASVSRGKIPDMVNISERPAEAEDRAVPGFWEGDLIFGRGMSPDATMVDRSPTYAMLLYTT